jgi:hypothetical protein
MNPLLAPKAQELQGRECPTEETIEGYFVSSVKLRGRKEVTVNLAVGRDARTPMLEDDDLNLGRP